MEQIYYDKYLKYKTKYSGLKHLKDLFKTRNWPEIIKANEIKYNNVLSKLQSSQARLKDLMIKETDATTNYYNDVSNKGTQKIYENAKSEVKKVNKKIKELEEEVLRTNKAWNDSIVKAGEARVNAAQDDVNEAKDNILKNKKEVLIDEKVLEKARKAQKEAEDKLQKDQANEGVVKNQLDITVDNLKRVKNEEGDNLAKLGSRSALSGISSEKFQVAEIPKGESA